MLLERVCAIYLAFHPSEEDLSYVRDLATKMDVVVVSNSGTYDFGPDVRRKHFFEENVGVGAGYNRGIELARETGVTHVVFHDQDSRLDIWNLDLALQRLQELMLAGESAVLSLNPVDLGTRQSRQPRVTKPKRVGSFLEFREVQFSGLVAPINLFGAKPFSTELFIDFVDFEWCWRVAPTVRLLRDETLTIGHCIGSGVRSILGIEYSLPSPTRFYFQWRNLAVLARSPNTPLQWKIRTTAKLALRGLLLPVLDRKQFIVCWVETARGIREGVSERYDGNGHGNAVGGR
jgi:rhamnosyltransferase